VKLKAVVKSVPRMERFISQVCNFVFTRHPTLGTGWTCLLWALGTAVGSLGLRPMAAFFGCQLFSSLYTGCSLLIFAARSIND
jgi:hypothetical protein